MKTIRFLSVLMAVLLLSILCAPAFASSGSIYNQKTSFWDWITHNPVSEWTGLSDILGYTFGAYCPNSSDGYHHANSYQVDKKDGTYKCICTYCGHSFTAYESDLQQSYDDYTASLPARGVTSEGHLIWYVPRSSVSGARINYTGGNNANGSNSTSYPSPNEEYTDSYYSVSTSSLTSAGAMANIRAQISVSSFPVSGSYRLLESSGFTGNIVNSDGVNRVSGNYSAVSSFSHYDSSTSSKQIYTTYANGFAIHQGPVFHGVSYVSFVIYYPVYEVIPDSFVDVTASSGTYSIQTRPTTVTGGNYGIIGDNNELTIVNGDIINETNNTYYNPATGQGDTITNWSYDYSDRSYNVTLESGDTVTVTYGDQNITIVEGGDTYIIYYIIEGNGSGSGESHTHNWTQTGESQGNCLTPSQRTYTCSVCGEQYTETDPVLGHSWRIIQEVSTKYDDSGNLIQEGYTIYECERCGEQYKSTNVTGPPSSGGSGSGGSSGSGGGNIFSSIFGIFADFLGFFFDFFTDFVVDGIKGFLSAILDAGSDLFAILNPFDWGY